MSRDRIYRSAFHRLVVPTVERLGGSRVGADLEVLSRTERFSRDDLKSYQLEKLRKLVAHAFKYVPYYRRLFDDAGIGADDVRSLDDLRRIPILTKEAIRDHAGELRATGSDVSMKVVEAQTGGTTGQPLKFFRTTDCNSFTRAALLRSYTWTGYRIGDPMLFLTGGSLRAAPQTFKQRAGFALMNFHFLPAFQMRRDTLRRYVDVARSKGIRCVRGYSTLLYQFAALCEDAGVDDLSFDAVYPTAEMLTRAQRDTIERVFHTRVYDQYGCAEINAIANECSEARKLHLIEEHVVVEEIDTEGGGTHSLVLTDLDNYAQPFIRYVNADRGKIAGAPCACGRNLGVLDEFLGRSSDAIILSSGERFAGVFFHHLFGHFPSVDHFQIVQDEPGELRVRIVRNARYVSGDEDKITALVHEHTSITPHIEYVEAIERSASGKITSVICRVDTDV